MGYITERGGGGCVRGAQKVGGGGGGSGTHKGGGSVRGYTVREEADPLVMGFGRLNRSMYPKLWTGYT